MRIIVDGLATNYEQTGSGRTLLILPGWAGKSSDWKLIGSSLSKKFEVITLDLPGFRVTESPKEPWGLDNYAVFISDFLTKINVVPYAIIGHSNGGAISIRGVSSSALKPQKLVLLASAGIRGEYKGRNRALRMIAKTGKVFTMPLPKSTKNKIRSKVYKTIGSDMLVAEHLQDTFKKIIGDDVRQDAAKITIPTLLIYGEADEQTPVKYGELFHEAILGSTLEILPGAGHFAFQDRETDVTISIKEFLE
jgi:pimeloyl-ACP methyl ester carboxylesterase